MHSSRMHTDRSLLYINPPDRAPPDRDPPGQRPPWTETHWTKNPLDREPLDRDPPGMETETTPVDRQTPVKTLPSETSFAGGNK